MIGSVIPCTLVSVPIPTRSDAGRSSGTVYRGRTVKPKRNWKILVISGVAAVVALVVLGAGYAYSKVSSYDQNLKREDPFSKITGGRPAKTVDGSMNILVVGSDNADDSRGYQGVAGQRTDSIMIVHIPASQDKAYLVSIPRDTYVTIPEHKGKGGGKDKINAAYTYGGAELLVRTVEKFSDVKLDHVITVGFEGFKTMTAAVGGVDVMVDQTTTDTRSKRTFKKGMNHLEGEAALDFVRQRYGLPNGDFDRQKRQQVFAKALLKKATSTGTLTNPTKLDAFITAATKSVTVDQSFSLPDMAMQFKNLRSDDITFLATPNSGTETIDGVSYVRADKEKASAMFTAMKSDKMLAWAQQNAKDKVNADSGS